MVLTILGNVVTLVVGLLFSVLAHIRLGSLIGPSAP